MIGFYYEGQHLNICSYVYSYCGNFMFRGVLEYDFDEHDFVIHNLLSGIKFMCSKLDNIHMCSGLDMCALPEDELKAYLNYRGL